MCCTGSEKNNWKSNKNIEAEKMKMLEPKPRPCALCAAFFAGWIQLRLLQLPPRPMTSSSSCEDEKQAETSREGNRQRSPDLSSRWDAVPRALVELEIDLEPENENTEIEMKNESDEKRWNENAAIANEEM